MALPHTYRAVGKSVDKLASRSAYLETMPCRGFPTHRLTGLLCVTTQAQPAKARGKLRAMPIHQLQYVLGIYACLFRHGQSLYNASRSPCPAARVEGLKRAHYVKLDWLCQFLASLLCNHGGDGRQHPLR